MYVMYILFVDDLVSIWRAWCTVSYFNVDIFGNGVSFKLEFVFILYQRCQGLLLVLLLTVSEIFVGKIDKSIKFFIVSLAFSKTV